MRPYDLAVVIVSVLLGVTAQQGFGAARERVIGQPGKQAVIVYLDRDHKTDTELWAFFWTAEPRCKAPERASVLAVSHRLADAPEAQIKAVAEKGAVAIQRLCGASFVRGAIRILVVPQAVTMDIHGKLSPSAQASLTVEYRDQGPEPRVAVTKYRSRQAIEQERREAQAKAPGTPDEQAKEFAGRTLWKS